MAERNLDFGSKVAGVPFFFASDLEQRNPDGRSNAVQCVILPLKRRNLACMGRLTSPSACSQPNPRTHQKTWRALLFSSRCSAALFVGLRAWRDAHGVSCHRTSLLIEINVRRRPGSKCAILTECIFAYPWVAPPSLQEPSMPWTENDAERHAPPSLP